MGRSKFPGKPSKHVHKKRVNVLPCNGLPDKHTPNDQNISTGISVTNNSHSNEEQVAISTEENCQTPDRPIEPADTQKQATNTSQNKCTLLTLRSAKRTEKITNEINSLCKSQGASDNFSDISICNNTVKCSIAKKNNDSVNSVNISDKDDSNQPVISESSVSSCRLTNQYDNKIDNSLKRKAAYARGTRKRQNKLNRTKSQNTNSSFRAHSNESNNLVGKFVLPSRSLHSSRVIKPNKKFLNDEQPHNTENTMKNCVKKSRTSENNRTEDNTSQEDKKMLKLSPNNTSQPVDNHKSDLVALDSINNSNSWSCGKLILRKARLQLHTQTSESGEGPFSNYSSSTVNPPGTVTCGVCGAVRFYRFVKQARKFNIYSCESCRKFISKMIKRQACTKTCSVPALVCHKGQGMCHVPPIVRSQQWKLIRCAYKARCPACWLKMCLRSFQMPLSLKTSLANMLPENMRLALLQAEPNKKIDISKPFNWKPLVFENSFARTNIFKTKMEKLAEKYTSPKIENLNKSDVSCNKQKKLRKTRMKTRRSSLVTPPQVVIPAESVKRQKLELKGPRVKHVCRSALVVLGQPVATFPSETTVPTQIQPQITIPTVKKTKEDPCDDCTLLNNQIVTDEAENNLVEVSKEIIEVTESVTPVCCKAGKYCRYYKNDNEEEISGEQQINTIENGIKVSSEYMDIKDPDYFRKYGYEIISSEAITVQAICYSCGSAGKEEMIHCTSCCEPYHTYCIEDACIYSTEPNSSWQLSWTCEKCTPCSSCTENNKSKISCRKCWKYYHNECLNPKSTLSKVPMLCSTCFCCNICGTENVSKKICKLLFCADCFKEQTTNNCCKENFNSDDFDIKMIECSQCKILFHIKCQDITENEYQILSYLSILFTCKSCGNNTSWKDLINIQIKNMYHSILRKISKNNSLHDKLQSMPEIICNCVDSFEVKSIESSEINKKSNKYEPQNDLKIDYELPKVLLNIKNKINNNFYDVKDFYDELDVALKDTEFINSLNTIFQNLFPWFLPRSIEIKDTSYKKVTKELKTYSKEALKPIKYLQDDNTLQDDRKCVFCKNISDSLASEEGRLLSCGLNEWTHVNCAFWSSDIYEQIDGTLKNVSNTIKRSKSIECIICKEKGATIYCSYNKCELTYHFKCARKNCIFTHDKNVFCSTHLEVNSNKLNDKDFEILRPIFIRIDRKKKNYIDPQNLKYFSGSLSVLNLGVFYAPLSDTKEAIITSDFVCTRLFWSTKEPWKIVQYKITTSVFPTQNFDDKYFIVDYSKNKSVIEKQLKEIERWKKELECGIEDKAFIKNENTKNDKIIAQVLDHLLESVCNKELEENCDDEPQNTTDILPPELKDAIFEDLPHDLLDGISMQDIFPKLMSYEDVLMDIKNSDLNDSTDFLKDNKNDDIINNLDSDEFLQFKCKKNDLYSSDNDLWFEPKSTPSEDNKIPTNTSVELKRSKSEVFSGIKKLTRNRNHQRSCSLTWSCKLDNSFATNMKKRKVSCTSKNLTSTDISSNLFMVVDSTSEKGSMLQELRLPESVLMTVGRSTNSECIGETVREFKYRLEENTLIPSDKFKTNNQQIELGKENKCRAWQNRSQTRLLQVDGADDLSSSESDSETPQISNDEPVKCDRCQCTYRTQMSYKRHLSTCDFISTSDSESEESINSDFNQVKIDNDIPEEKSIPTTLTENPIPVQVTITPKHLSDSDKPEYNISCNIFPTNIQQNTEILTTENKNIITPNIQTEPIIEQPVLNLNQPTVINNPNNFVLPKTVTVNKPINTNVRPQLVTIPKPKPIPIKKPIQNNRSKSRAYKTVKRLRTETPIQVLNQLPSQNGINLMHQNYTNQNPTIIIQHMQPSIVPTYIDTFQQQTGQNLQCIATIMPSENKPITFLPHNNVVPGIYHMQSDSQNLMNNGISIIPNGLQIGQPQQVMGTIIQQPRSTIQCGMMTEQLVLGSLPTMETLVADNSGSMFLTTPQPVYYGFETIVQNTVMQSQQFLSTTTVPGVLSNSSYSATTTQVFQASKIEPVVEMNGNGYIIVNPQVQQIATPLPNTSHSSVINIVQNRANVFPQQVQESITQPILEPIQHIDPLPMKIEHLPPPVYTQPNEIPVSRYMTPPPLHQPPIEATPSPPKPHPQQTTPTNSITLPLAPYPTDNTIPMNIVNPIPQVNLPSTQTPVSRPMNRVLPMQTPQREFQKLKSPPSKVLAIEPPDILNRLSETVDKIQETLSNETESVLNSKTNLSDSQTLKLESASLKLVFQKQSQDGIYKISNKYISKSNMPLQLSPTKTNKVKAIEVKNIQPKKEPEIKPKLQENKIPQITYKIQSQDGFNETSASLSGLWEKVFDAVQKARAAHNMPLLPQNTFSMFNGLQLMGLKSNGLKYVMEQLPGAARCVKYKPEFHKEKKLENQSLDVEASLGAVRCIPHKFQNMPYDMFSWLASRHRRPDYSIQFEPDVSSRRSSINLPVAMRYRQLKETFKHAVGVYPSNIHGRGLFCLRDIDSGEMVIEYAGEVIRSTLTDKREKYYNSKSIGCYMFRIDDNLVIDATMKGNAARFINHSCDPNCYSRVLDILGHKHIIIFALRKIQQGEELTYDYKFPFEEDKIPCTCGSKKCRKYLN